MRPRKTTTSASTGPSASTIFNKMSVPCAKFSNPQNLNKAMNVPEWHEKCETDLEQAKARVRFCVDLMPQQLAAAKHFLFEHPAWASSWDMPELQSLVDTPGVLWKRADQCMYGLGYGERRRCRHAC